MGSRHGGSRPAVWALLGLAAFSNIVGAEDATLKPHSDADQTAVIQEKLNQAAGNGRIVELPPGKFVLGGSLSVPPGVTLRGSWQGPHSSELDQGTVLLAYGGRGAEDGPALISLHDNSVVEGLTICYPEQTCPDVAPYPWTIEGVGHHNTIRNITLVNSYNGIAVGLRRPGGLHLIRNVYGCVLRRGIMIDQCYDIGRIENVHFNPHYWGHHPELGGITAGKNHPNMVLARYMQQNLEAFIFARTDWQYVHNTFVFAARVGYLFTAVGHHGCNGQFSGIGADMCQYGIVVQETQPISLLITNGEFVCGQLADFPAPSPRIGIWVKPSAKAAGVQLINCSFWGRFTHFARVEGDVRFTLAHATADRSEEAGIDLVGGRACIQDVMFTPRCRAEHIRVGADVTHAVVTGNFAEGGVRIINEAGDRLYQAGNEPTRSGKTDLHGVSESDRPNGP